MNKFHVNIPEASEPQSVALVACRGKIVDKKSIAKVTEKLTFTVNDSTRQSGTPVQD